MKEMLVQHIMTRSFRTVECHDTLEKVVELLRESKLDGLPVIDAHGKLIGMMPKANLFDALLSRLPLSTPVAEIFVREPVAFRESMPYTVAAETVKNTKIGSAPVVNRQGKVTGVVTKASWIMAMFQEQSLLNSQLTAIYDSMHNGLIVTDEQGRITSLNAAARRILNIIPSEWVGKRADRLLPGLDLEHALKGRSLIGVEQRVRGLRLLSNVTPVVSQLQGDLDAIQGAVVVFQDLTEMERMTELYETLESVLKLAYDGIMVVDEKCRITMVNQAMADFLDSGPDEMVGKSIQHFVKNSRLPKVVRTGIAEMNQVHVFDGRKPYLVSRQPVMRGGRVIGAVGRILFQNHEVLKDLAEKLESQALELKYYKNRLAQESGNNGFAQIMTADPEFIHVKEDARVAARGSSSILITGESGTGKELLAQAIHRDSGRRGPIVRVNCAAIPESLLESEFFGYVDGAFTGARQGGKQGKLSLADGGTLFMDELGDMSLFLQGKLLRVLQDGTFEPVGSNRSVKVNIRVIAATNKDLEQMVSEGTFRSDLYYRLNVIRLHIPSLRERREDVILLAYHFLKKYNEIFGKNIKECTGYVRNILMQHDWPGNVRELENVVERAINFALGSTIEVDDLPLYLRDESMEKQASKPVSQREEKKMLRQRRDDADNGAILAALEQTAGNKAKAAKLLGISRTWLYAKMSRADLQLKTSNKTTSTNFSPVRSREWERRKHSRSDEPH